MAEEVALEDLFSKLELATENKRRGRCTRVVNKIETGDVVTSWKFNEFEYSSSTIELPSQARGLFTANNRIIVRGYDKFFNVEEVAKTKWQAIEQNTAGPYVLSLKENGCIVFMAGLNEDGELLVTSKHLFGNIDVSNRGGNSLSHNHAMRGRLEVEEQLSRASFSPRELGKYLFEHNMTAVAELCDDSFEEHVLPYSKEDAGLYLHGLNYNTVKFKTAPMSTVDSVADKFGFKKVDHFTIDNFSGLKEFLERCSETGTYKEREIEGFVIRTKDASDDGADFFFKYKFEEPYLMYRDMREVTRRYIEGTPKGVLKFEAKRHRYVIYKYIDFMDNLLKMEQPSLVDEFKRGKGVIKIRELFLSFLGSRGMSLLKLDRLNDSVENLDLSEIDFKYVLMPIASIGCGKTTAFKVIENLYPKLVSHVQNDNISKGSRFKLTDECLNEFAEDENKMIALCDRNNSSFNERSQLFTDFKLAKPKFLLGNVVLKFICCNFISPDADTLWEVTHNRVLARGDNHQSIKAQTSPLQVAGIMSGFILRRNDLDMSREPDKNFAFAIDLTVDKDTDSLDNAKKILSHLHEKFPGLLPDYPPTEEQYQVAFKKALEYVPTFTKIMPGQMKSKKKVVKVQYYGIRITEKDSLVTRINTLIAPQSLEELARVQTSFHVTVAHVSSRKIQELKPLWKKLNDEIFAVNLALKLSQLEIKKQNPSDGEETKIATESVSDPQVDLDFWSDISIKSVVIAKDKLVCLEAEILETYDSQSDDAKVVEGVECTNQFPHVTIGTANEKILNFESNNVLEEVRNTDKDRQQSEYTLEDGTEVKVIDFKQPLILSKQRIFAHK